MSRQRSPVPSPARVDAQRALAALGAALLVVGSAPRLTIAQAPETANAFAAVASRTLPNGLKVWERPFAGDATVT